MSFFELWTAAVFALAVYATVRWLCFLADRLIDKLTRLK